MISFLLRTLAFGTLYEVVPLGKLGRSCVSQQLYTSKRIKSCMNTFYCLLATTDISFSNSFGVITYDIRIYCKHKCINMYTWTQGPCKIHLSYIVLRIPSSHPLPSPEVVYWTQGQLGPQNSKIPCLLYDLDKLPRHPNSKLQTNKSDCHLILLGRSFQRPPPWVEPRWDGSPWKTNKSPTCLVVPKNGGTKEPGKTPAISGMGKLPSHKPNSIQLM